jgi:hypothetical protein
MKKLFVLFVISGLVLSCKKETGGPKKVLLAEIKVDGLVERRMEYNSDNLITKIEGYVLEQTNNTVQTYITFQYNSNGTIKEYTGYGMPGNIPVAKITLQYDSTGKMVSSDYYDLLSGVQNSPIWTTTFTYNNKGLVIKTSRKNKSGNLIEQINLAYYDGGHLKERSSWKEGNGALWNSSKFTYSVPSGYYPTGMEQLQVLEGWEFIAGMHSDAINYRYLFPNGAIDREYSESMSGRQYNEDGTLNQQVVTRNSITPDLDPRSETREYKYIAR